MWLVAEYGYNSVLSVYERLMREVDYPPTTLQLIEDMYPTMQENFAFYIMSRDLYDMYGLRDQNDLLEAIRSKELPEPLTFEEVHYVTRMLNLVTFENHVQGVW